MGERESQTHSFHLYRAYMFLTRIFQSLVLHRIFYPIGTLLALRIHHPLCIKELQIHWRTQWTRSFSPEASESHVAEGVSLPASLQGLSYAVCKWSFSLLIVMKSIQLRKTKTMDRGLDCSLLINLLNYLILQTKEIVIQPMTVKMHFFPQGDPLCSCNLQSNSAIRFCVLNIPWVQINWL